MNKTALLNNRYQIIETLGRGGFGETFLAIDTHLPSGKKCAIKQLKPIIQEPEIPSWMSDRFQQEARILEYLGEENRQIPRLYAYFSEKDNFYLVQEWIEGVTLKQKVERDGSLSPAEVEKLLSALLPLLDFVHRQNIVHRDIKPDNIILRSKDGLPVLIDFGSVKEAMTTIVHQSSNSAYSIAIGTPGYMPSEQAAGRPIYSSDLYSLGLTAVYLLTGKSPQYLKTDSRTGEILWREAAPDLHSPLAAVLDRAIRFNPRDRFFSAADMLAALKPLSVAVSAPSQQATAVVARKNPTQSLLSRQQTIAFKADSLPKRKNNPLKQLIPLFLLSGVGIGSFIFGFSILLETNRQTGQSSPSEIVNQPEEELFPPKQNPPKKERQIATKPETEQNVGPVTPEKTPEPDIPSITAETQPVEPEIEPAAPETSPPPPPETPSTQKLKSGTPPATPVNNPTSIPVFPVGSSEGELLNKIGKPTFQGKGYWSDSVAILYQDAIPNQVDLGYLLDRNTRKVRQTEISFAPSTDLTVIKNTVNNLLGGNAPDTIINAVREVYQRKTDLRSFQLDNLKGMVQRNNKDRIYIGIWDADFH